MHQFLPFIVIGLATGSVYGLAGLGLVLTYKTSGVFNFGYGAVAALAAFVFYLVHDEHGIPWPIAAAICLGVLAPLVGILLELMARSLDRATETMKVAATVGLILITEAIASFWFPINPPAFPHFLPQSRVKLAGVYITWEQIIVFLFALVASGVLFWFFRSTRLGIVMRGVVDSDELVSMCGDSPVKVRRSAWVIGTVFASLAGLMLAPGQPLDGVSLPTLVFAAFGAAAFGFFTNLPLTFVGGLLIGVAGAILDKYAGTISWVGGIPPSLPFIILFLILILTPKARLFVHRVAVQVSVRQPYQAPVRVRLVGGTITIVLLAMVPAIQTQYLAVWSGALIDMILFLSLGLLVRKSGQISLCQLAFAAVGAGAFGHFTSNGVPWFLALLLAALVAVPVGALIAIPAVRVSGVFLALATLGFGILAQYSFYNRSFMFGTAEQGLLDPRPAVSIAGLNLASDKGFYYVLLVITVVIVVSLTLINRGRLGRLLQGMADSQLALETRGVTSSLLKVIVFCISASMAALAGALTGMLYHFGEGTYFQSFGSLTLVVLVVIITAGDPWYAVIGAIGNQVVPGYFHGSNNVNSALTLLFGVSAVAVAYTTRLGGMPLALRSLLDRLGGRRPGAEPVAEPAPPYPDSAWVSDVSRPGAGSTGSPGLEVRNLSVSYGGVRAVDGVSLGVPLGRVTGLIGPNGAGKTTLFNACSGLTQPTGGEVLLYEHALRGDGPALRARRGLGRTFQRPQLFDSLTVRQNVALGREAPMAGGNPLTQLRSSHKDDQIISAAADEAILVTGTERIAAVQAGLLPIGQRRLVELAMILAGPFRVLLLDEPSSGLDGHETEAFGRLLRLAAADKGLAILLVEHDMTLVRQVCDYVYVLDFGSLIFEGTPMQMEQSEKVRIAYLGETVGDDLDISVPPEVAGVLPPTVAE